MLSEKKDILMVIFAIFMVFLVGVITYSFINFGKEKEKTPLQIKTRAIGKTYRKEIALKISETPISKPFSSPLPYWTPEPSLTKEPTPTSISTSTGTPVPTLTPTEEFTPTKDFILTQEITPTPTDIIVAKVSSTEEPQQSEVSPTKVESLPKAGYFYYYLFIFAIGIFIIILSLVV